MADSSERAQRGGGKETAVSPGLLSRITGMLAGMRAGFTTGWFPPGEPLRPVAPDPADVKGRRFDYPYGINLSYGPRTDEVGGELSFPQLRRLADPAMGGLDLLRLAIETRKDQMMAQKWTIRGKSSKEDDGGDPARKLEEALRKPDGQNTFRQWMKLLLEDHFVIDAPTMYFRPIGEGQPPLLEVMDGGTIKLLIDDRGRTPVPPLPAYQQVIKGLPAVDYTTKELGYYVYNPRPNRIYGMSRVEQVIGIVTLALNRQLSVLAYYTVGNIPEQMIGVPDTWTVDQIKDMQIWFDSILEGQVDKKRKAWFMPGKLDVKQTKDAILKDEFDEWLARIICYAFSLSHQALVKEMNRSTAQTSQQQSAEEGLEPTKLWFKDVMDDVLLRCGFPMLEWVWKDEEIQDALTKAQVISTYTGGRPVIGLTTARAMLGLPEATGEEAAQLDGLWTQPADPFGAGPGDGSTGDGGDGKDPSANGNGKKENDPAAKSRRGRSLPPSRNHAATATSEQRIAALVRSVLAAQLSAIQGALDARTAKADVTKGVGHDDVTAMLRALDDTPWSQRQREKLRTALKEAAKERADAALRAIRPGSPGDEVTRTLLNQANERAVAWAENRAGNLVTQVSNTTRNAINELSARAIAAGQTNGELARQIEDAYEFSEHRAALIATTETATAETAGTLSGWQESGVVDEKEWSADEEACDECALVDGERVALGSNFSNGTQGPPGHPGCRCAVVPVVHELASG